MEAETGQAKITIDKEIRQTALRFITGNYTPFLSAACDEISSFLDFLLIIKQSLSVAIKLLLMFKVRVRVRKPVWLKG